MTTDVLPFSLNLEISTEQFIAYAAVILMAIAPLYLGCRFSLTQPTAETMSSSDAWSFPLIGSAVLFGLYLLFKFLSKDLINLLLMFYFLGLGIGAVGTTVAEILHSIMDSKEKKKTLFSFTPFWNKENKWEFSWEDLLGLFIGCLVAAWYVLGEKHWISSNIFALCFCIQGISLLSLGSYRNGCILLSGLFFYDIFWVFGTEVMVTVAKSFDAPVKLLFPKNIFTTEAYKFSMLGLGDIVIPGFFIALLLRFDSRNASPENRKAFNFAKPYFHSNFLAYFVGLVSAIVIMHLTGAAQPVLLYLVPACLGTSLVVSFIKGQFNELWNFSTESEKESEKPGKKED